MCTSKYLFAFAIVSAIIGPATSAPDPLITPKPKAPTGGVLQHRQDDSGPNVYGYIDGDANSPMGCGAGYQWSSSGDSGGCCNQVSCTNVIATCVDRAGGLDVCSGAWSELCALQSISVLKCKSPEPSCFRYMRITDSLDTNPIYIHRCGTAAKDITVMATPTNEAGATQSSEPSLTQKATSVLRSTPVASNTKIFSQDSSQPTDGTISPNTSGNTNPNTGGTPAPPKSNTWKYAAIGVSGFIFIVVLIVAIFFLRKLTHRVKEIKYQGVGANPNMGYQATDTSQADPTEVTRRNLIVDEWRRTGNAHP